MYHPFPLTLPPYSDFTYTKKAELPIDFDPADSSGQATRLSLKSILCSLPILFQGYRPDERRKEIPEERFKDPLLSAPPSRVV